MKIKDFSKKIKNLVTEHKKTSIVILIVLIVVLYYVYQSLNSGTKTTYVTSAVNKGNITSVVSGSGQVSALDEVSVKSKTSGDISDVNVVSGQEVKAGDLLVKLDTTDAAYNLESEEITYQKLINIDPNDLRTTENSLSKASDSLESSYNDAKIALVTASTNMTDVVNGLKDLFDYNSGFLSEKDNYNISGTSKEYRTRAEDSLNKADKALTQFLKSYTDISNTSDKTLIENTISDAYTLSFNVSEATKYSQDAVVYFIDHEDNTNSTASNSAYTSVVSLVSKANSILSSLSSAKNSINTAKRSYEDAQVSLDDLKDGPDVLDVRSEALNLKQKQDAYNNCFIKAPFDGYVASISVEKNDSISSGGTVATIITKQKIAKITLNEVDAAKVKVGQKVNITFDAISDLNMTGKVSEMDTVGTVSSGVVNYTATIVFDTQDDRVKAGMSASVSIITDMKNDILIVPNESVKSEGDKNYVEVLETGSETPVKKYVEVGISDDTSIEILSGINEGDNVVTKTTTTSSKTTSTTKTTTSSTKSTTKSATSLFGGMGGGPRD